MNAIPNSKSEPFQVNPQDWLLYTRMLARIGSANLHPTDIQLNFLKQAVFYIPRKELATRAQLRTLLRLTRRSPWFADTMVVLIVRRILPDLQAHLSELKEAFEPSSGENPGELIGERISMSDHEYWNQSIRFWVPLSLIWRVGSEEMRFYAQRR